MSANRRSFLHCRLFHSIVLFLSLIASSADLQAESFSITGFSGEDSIDIQADTLEIDAKNESLSARGHVKIISPAMQASANNALWDKSKGILKLEGQVEVETKEASILADSLEYDIKSGEMLALLAKLSFFENEPDKDINSNKCCKRKAYFEAESIRRTADGRFMAEGGSFTPCDCGDGEKPSWQIDAKKIESNPDDSATATWPVFKIKGTPVFALPAASFPTTNRKTGFLAPRISYTDRNGFLFGDDFFWAFHKSADATFGLDFMTERGFKSSAETRYHFRKIKGEVSAFYLPDWSRNTNEKSFNRFAAKARQVWRPSDFASHKIKAELLSDGLLPEHFKNDWHLRERDFTRTSHGWEFFGENWMAGYQNNYYQDLSHNLEHNQWLWNTSGQSPAYLMPSLLLAAPNAYFADGHILLDAALSGTLVHYLGEERNYSPTASATPYPAAPFSITPKDLTDPNPAGTGFLLIATPRLSFPFKLFKAIDIKPYLEATEKLYAIDSENDSVYLEGWQRVGLDIESRLWRVFDIKQGAIKHEISPALSWSYIPLSHDNTPKDSHALRFLDFPDTADATHYVEARLGNRLALRHGDRINGRIWRFLEFNLAQKLFIERVTYDKEKHLLDDGRMELILRGPKSEWKNSLAIRYSDASVQSAASHLTLGPFYGGRIEAHYRLLEDGPLLGQWLFQRAIRTDERYHQAGGNISWTFAEAFTLKYAVDVSLQESRLIEQSWLAAYRSRCNCWKVSLSIAHRPGMNVPDMFLHLNLGFM